MGYYFLIILAAVFPLALAGYGGHLATLALQAHSKERRKALFIVWGLAILGVVAFGVSQIFTYRSDRSHEREDVAFRSDVRNRLQQIIDEPNENKKKQDASVLSTDITKAGELSPRIPAVSSITSKHNQQGVFTQVSPNGKFPGTIYTLPYIPKSASSTLLYYNGILQRQGTDYTVSSNTIKLNFRTMSGDALLVTFYH